MSISAGQLVVSPFDNTSTCSCPSTFLFNPSGGLKLNSGAVISGGRQTANVSGGCVCSGSAIVSTNKLWDAYAMVFHTSEISDGITGEFLNSACSVLNGTGKSIGQNGHFPNTTTGAFYLSAETDRTCYISVPSDNFNNQTSLTISGWVRNTTSFMDGIYYQRGINTPTNSTSTSQLYSIILGKYLDQTIYAKIQVIGTTKQFTATTGGNYNLITATSTYSAKGTTIMTAGCWYFAVVTWDCIAGTLSVYLNNSLEGSTNGVPYTTFYPSSSGSGIANPCSVDICEIRVSTDVKSTNWLTAEYENLCSPSSMYSVGSSQGIYS